ncbi:chaperonin 10-like protein [Hygrophoropsis aurantiaca]|uniref:Chaperonin 10-like protein n=1 Tax=Hygrophoropsis aurantiaca TaxID=72124 RepID=A0ACB8AQN9_9AGAM|nr:chaperonin 10-like protein [Hygrophoropsis aurantiaca]
MSTHTGIATTSKGVVQIIEVDTQKPPFGHVLVKVSHTAIIPLDTYMSDHGRVLTESDYPMVLGFNVSGVIAEVGSGVEDLAVGDRIAAMGVRSASKGLQEYAILSRDSCAKIPDNLTLEEAATIPDNFITAFYTLFDGLGLPIPTFPISAPPPRADTPILIYGAGATSGHYCIQLLSLAGYKNIIATASTKHHPLLRSLGAQHVVDYRDADLSDKILFAAGGKVTLAVDCISARGTLGRLAKVMSADSSVALLLPVKEGDSVAASESGQMWMEVPADWNPFAPTVKLIGVRTLLYQENEYMRDNLMQKILPYLLREKIIEPNRVRLFEHGTLKERADAALELVRSGQVSGEKPVVKVQDV